VPETIKFESEKFRKIF